MQCPEAQWPVFPILSHSLPLSETGELRTSAAYYLTQEPPTTLLPDASAYSRLEDLIKAAARMAFDGAATASSRLAAETLLIWRAWAESFPEELQALRKGKCSPTNSRLLSLSPELDPPSDIIRVGGRIRCAELEPDALPPLVLDGEHPVSKLLIKSYDEQLLHPGQERVHGEMHGKYWVQKGWSAIKNNQNSCQECRKWSANPDFPKMADLPTARLRLFKPPFGLQELTVLGHFRSNRATGWKSAGEYSSNASLQDVFTWTFLRAWMRKPSSSPFVAS